MLLDSYMPKNLANFPTAHFPQMDWQVRIKQPIILEAMKREGDSQDRKKKSPSKVRTRKQVK